MVFDVKMYFTRKARYVAGRHMTEPPAVMTYSSVVARVSVRIKLLVAALNDLNVTIGYQSEGLTRCAEDGTSQTSREPGVVRVEEHLEGPVGGPEQEL